MYKKICSLYQKHHSLHKHAIFEHKAFYLFYRFQNTYLFEMKKFILSCLVFQVFFCSAQQETSIPWAMFHACEKHCGVYPVKEYKDFGNVKWKLKTGGKIFSSPALLNGVAYIGSEDKNLYAVDVVSGKTIWKFKTQGAVHSSPAVYDNVVYFGSYDGYYYAVDATGGKEKWKFKTEGEKRVGAKGLWTMKPSDLYMEDLYDFFLSSPIVNMDSSDGIVYFGSSDGNLYALDAQTGSLRWKFKTGGIIHSSPALFDGVVYIGSWDTYLYAIDAKTGEQKWKFKTGDHPGVHLLEGIQASPAYYDGMVYLGARDGYFYAIKASTGEMAWKYSADNSWIVTTAAAKDDVVYFGTSDSYLFIAVDAKTGIEKFKFKAHGYVYSSPAIVNNTAYFGDFTGAIYAIDLASGAQFWHTTNTSSSSRNGKKVLNAIGDLDFAYAAAGDDASMYATGAKVMDKFYSLGSIVSSPVIAKGVIYFGSADGYLYAVNLEKESEGTTTQSHHNH